MQSIEHSDWPSPDKGGYNGWPKKAKRLRREEAEAVIGRAIFLYNPTHIEYRQAQRKGAFRNLMILWFPDNTGLMAECEELNHKVKHWYHVGCEHDYRETVGGGMCYHVEKCAICGQIRSFDTSG